MGSLNISMLVQLNPLFSDSEHLVIMPEPDRNIRTYSNGILQVDYESLQIYFIGFFAYNPTPTINHLALSQDISRCRRDRV